LFIYFRKHHENTFWFLLPLISFFIVGKSLLNEIMIIFDLHWEYTPFSN